MTQILGVVTRSCSFHVSDRLLTQASQSGYRKFDTLSNKSIVFLASDALVTIGYSGQAFIDGQTTDEWIVAGLLDIDRPSTSLAWAPRHLVPHWPSLGEAIERLRSRASKVLSGSILDRDSPIAISIEGWRWKKRIR